MPENGRGNKEPFAGAGYPLSDRPSQYVGSPDRTSQPISESAPSRPANHKFSAYAEPINDVLLVDIPDPPNGWLGLLPSQLPVILPDGSVESSPATLLDDTTYAYRISNEIKDLIDAGNLHPVFEWTTVESCSGHTCHSPTEIRFV